MKRKKKKDAASNIRLIVAFFVLVLVFIAISLVFKLGIILSKSIYDDSNRFTIKIENGKDLRIMSFSGRSKLLSLLYIKDVQDININKLLAIPIDASIATSFRIKEDNISDLIANLILNYAKLETNLTIIDMAKIYLFTKTVPTNNLSYNSVSLSWDNKAIDKIISELVRDEAIEKENLTIKVVNSTDVDGLGGRLARLISNMGGNVVLIESADKTEPQSTIYYFGEKSYTVEKLEEILGYTSNKLGTRPITDVVLVIGEDGEKTNIF